MKLDENPKGMALIMLAIGVFGIGVILVLGFYDSTELMGVGITMAVVGGAGSILGCIHMGSVQKKKKQEESGIAPPRIPPPTEIVFQDSVMAPDEDLTYERFSASPPRPEFSPAHGGPKLVDASWVNQTTPGANRFETVNSYNVVNGASVGQPGFGTPTRTGSVLPTGGGAAGPLSPFERRSFPVPPSIPMTSARGSPDNNQHNAMMQPPFVGGNNYRQGNTNDALSFNNRSASYGYSPATGGGRGGSYAPQDRFGNGIGYNHNSSTAVGTSGYRRGQMVSDGYSPGRHSVVDVEDDQYNNNGHNPYGRGSSGQRHARFADDIDDRMQYGGPSRSGSGARAHHGSLSVRDTQGAMDAYAVDDDALPDDYWGDEQ